MGVRSGAGQRERASLLRSGDLSYRKGGFKDVFRPQ